MIVRRYEPFDMFERMSEALGMARDLDDFFSFDESMHTNNTWGVYEGDWSPRLDYEDDDAYFIKVDMPGISQKDVELSVTNNVLTIKGERKSVSEEDTSKKKGRKYQREERFYGTFHRTIPLALPVESNKVDAKLVDGVLHITLPKREETKPKKISVNVS